jgi:aryl-alcohol dehydrogenase-like predicted oxidoreductase/enamine deaminase RidA (YjgF/YER057c/UK114 family)
MERGETSLDLEAAANAMKPYVDAGLTSFDMADHYGSAEDVAGLFVEETDKHSSVEIATKWVPQPGPVRREDVRRAVERALERLRSSRLDLLQFHAWSYADPSYLDALFYLQELKEEGLIGHLGLTNFDTAHLRVVLASGIDVVCNQISFSLFDRRAQGSMSKLCVENGVKLLAYGTLAGGLLTDRFLGLGEPAEMKTWSEMKYKRFLDLAGNWQGYQELLKVLAEVADRHGVSIANVSSRYILQQPAVGGVIIGARLGESEHIEENLRVFSFELDEEEVSSIETVLDDFVPIPGDCGDEYRKPPFLTASGDLSHHFEEFPLPYEVRDRGDGRIRVLTGTYWEAVCGFCRAVREGRRVWVSGTTASHGDRLIGGADPVAQTHFAIDKIEGALQSLGARLEDIVRTRIYVADIAEWQEIAEVHGERLRHVQPANTLVEATLVGEGSRVEIEAEAVTQAGSTK